LGGGVTTTSNNLSNAAVQLLPRCKNSFLDL
jgi:hypothetical protein